MCDLRQKDTGTRIHKLRDVREGKRKRIVVQVEIPPYDQMEEVAPLKSSIIRRQ